MYDGRNGGAFLWLLAVASGLRARRLSLSFRLRAEGPTTFQPGAPAPGIWRTPDPRANGPFQHAAMPQSLAHVIAQFLFGTKDRFRRRTWRSSRSNGIEFDERCVWD
jgi:hypothetical protein